ncbi:hypothetical protein [Acidovorax sp. K2F]|uniref:hypothetical protein n=1 Tax=Acidovorax sp. K2F TaxID=2978125 RepID=UPI0021B0C21D|nr:hypothetical protein [Acidovorax sp. K2F]MCT6719456.1 hypothetical protein [Acidovorax sp. K2F]
MYADPALIRKNFVKLSLSDREAALIDAMCAYTGEQKATLLRDMVLKQAEMVLHSANSAFPATEMRSTNSGLLAA